MSKETAVRKREHYHAVREEWRAVYKPRVSRQQRLRELRCYWTPPFGHLWLEGRRFKERCAICEKYNGDVEG